MKITICLVSKGRPEYLEDCLASISRVLDYDFVDFLIIDNGSAPQEQLVIENWVNSHENRGELIRLDVNDTHSATLWNLIKTRNLDWVTFPGDDDVIQPHIYEKIHNLVSSDSELIAIGASAKILYEDGGNSTQTLIPAIHNTASKLSALATSFHEAPFVWPALFFKVGKLPIEVPNSRYVFDWWIGCQLVLNGKWLTLTDIAISYRIHKSQESNAVSTRRKFHEANLMLSSLAMQKELCHTIITSEDIEIINFFNDLLELKPLYGDTKYFVSILTNLILLVRSIEAKRHLYPSLIASFTAATGVFVKGEDLDNYFGAQSILRDFVTSNLNLIVLKDSCDELINTVELLNNNAANLRFTLGCIHSKSRIHFLEIDCRRLKKCEPFLIKDFVLTEITATLENAGELDLTLSSGERWIIKQVRILRRFTPKSVQKIAKELRKINSRSKKSE